LESPNIRCPEKFYRRGRLTRRRPPGAWREGLSSRGGSLADSGRQCRRPDGPRRAAPAEGEQSDREAVDFYYFTSVIKSALDGDGCQKIVEILWDIAFADGLVDEFEENTMWRIAELLGVSTRDRVLLRQWVAAQMPRGAPFEGPWAAPSAKGKA
jgi:tellurite resistance protein TerB